MAPLPPMAPSSAAVKVDSFNSRCVLPCCPPDRPRTMFVLQATPEWFGASSSSAKMHATSNVVQHENDMRCRAVPEVLPLHVLVLVHLVYVNGDRDGSGGSGLRPWVLGLSLEFGWQLPIRINIQPNVGLSMLV